MASGRSSLLRAGLGDDIQRIKTGSVRWRRGRPSLPETLLAKSAQPLFSRPMGFSTGTRALSKSTSVDHTSV
jgi:hypothetical protein